LKPSHCSGGLFADRVMRRRKLDLEKRNMGQLRSLFVNVGLTYPAVTLRNFKRE
jgi:hypothetical protein